MSERLIAAFAGPLSISLARGAPNLVLRGRERRSGAALEVLFSGSHIGSLPGRFQDVEVYETDADVRGWRVTEGARSLSIDARAVQVHRSAEDAFYRAVPALRESYRARLGWPILLTLLRVPGATQLLRWIRTR